MDILGIGNALIDIFCFSDDETALSLGLHPNQATHVTSERLDELLLAVPSRISVSGGSASNTVKAAAALGASCAFVGCVGTEDRERDIWGQIFAKELVSFGVQCVLENRKETSGRCLIIHMPGGLKSIACAPGAAPTIHPEQITPTLITQAKIVHLDGQVLRNAAVTDRIVSLCKEHDILLTIDGASADIIHKYTDRILDILKHNDCILFLNDNEALALAKSLEEGTISADTGLQTADEYIDTVLSFLAPKKSHFPCIVQKKGSNGAKAWMKGLVYEASTDSISNPLDDTGAGDTVDGAFLAAWLNEATLEECLSFANEAAREVLMVPGTRLDEQAFTALRNEKLPGKHL